jgi:hypothetical protein
MSKQHAPPRFTPLLDDELLSERAVRESLNCTSKTLYRRRRDGTLPGIPLNSRRYLYRKSAVMKFLAAAEAGTLCTYTHPPAVRSEEREKTPAPQPRKASAKKRKQRETALAS